MTKNLSLNGIRGRLFLLLLIVLVSVLLVEVFVYYRRFETQKSEELQANLEMARALAKNFETFILDIVHSELLIGLALITSQPISDGDRIGILDKFQADNPPLRGAFWMNDQGLVITSNIRSYIGFNLSDRSFFQRVKEGREWAVSELIIGRATNKPAFTVSRGIRNEEGKLLGVVAASVEPDRLDSVLGIERLKDAGVSLVDNKGMHVYRYPATEYTWDQRNWLKHYPMIENSLKGKSVFTSVISESTGERRLVVFTPVSSIGWVAAASRSEDLVMKAITTTLLFQAGLVFLVTLVGFGAAVALARPISNSIIRLRNHALALGRGEMGNLAPVSGPEELKDLAIVFNQMTGEVRSREAALRESEQRWATILASIGDAVIATDLSGNIRFMNKIAEELTGWTFSEASTKPVADVFNIINEHTRNRVEDPVAKVLKEGVIVGLANHTVLVGKNGKEIPIDDSGAPIRDHDGRVLGVVLIFRDITERKRGEEAVSRSQKTLSELVERSPFGTYVVDSQFRIAMMNTASQDGAFRNVRPVIGRDFAEAMRILWPEPVAAEIIAVFRHTLETGEPYYSPRFTNPRHDVETVESYEWELHRMTLPDGQYGVICYYFDSTKLRDAEEALRRSEERFRRYFELGLIGMTITSPTKGIIEANDEICKILGYERDELLQKTWAELTHPEDLGADGAQFNRVMSGEIEGYTIDKRFICKDGQVVDTTISVRALRGADGSVDYFLALLQDITEHKRAEAALQKHTLELQKLTETLEERVKERTAELANVSSRLVSAQENERKRVSYDLHDNVWQMLVAIRFEIERLFSGPEDWIALRSKSKQVMTDIVGLVGRIRSMQGDLWPYVMDDIGIAATIGWYCREFEKNHSGIAIEIKNEFTDGEIPSSAKIVIYRILQEALDNVAKHSQANHVALNLNKNDHRMEFTIEDNGSGFDPEETIARRTPWGGLGLLNIKARTEISGGFFGVDSGKGKGTIVRASWPL
jgi:PAS domain S-box-containing protein